MQRQLVFAFIWLALAAFDASAEELEGVPLPDQIQVGSHKLRLNGAGIRYGLMFKVYVIALHAERPQPTPEKILYDATQVRRLTLTMLLDLTRDQAVRAFEAGLRRNYGDGYDALRVKLAPFFDLLRDAHKGERIELTAWPKKGISVLANDRKAEIAGDDASRAIFSIWLGDQPVDHTLRMQLIARASSP